MTLSYKTSPLIGKSVGWFLYDSDFRHERVNEYLLTDRRILNPAKYLK